ncbi:MAG: ATP synthase F1 subunit epsilon [Bacteroidetes bacterium HGW-Bacteroidetes-4]|jgi:F-type H+-transporting ATPase subunit epsilon|nr:MAG: ATP synthase F1 subunit epsilon [Bacteroidetes bacterium HGW-Bacteroidetes-4]
MHLEIVSPDKKVFSGEVKLVQVPGSDGSFEILKNHAPIISTLQKGRVKIVEMDDKEHFFEIEKGVIEVNNNKIVLLAERI